MSINWGYKNGILGGATLCCAGLQVYCGLRFVGIKSQIIFPSHWDNQNTSKSLPVRQALQGVRGGVGRGGNHSKPKGQKQQNAQEFDWY